MLNLHRELIALRREFVDEPYETVAVDDAVLRVPPRAVRRRAEPVRRGGGAARRARAAQHGARRRAAERLRPNEGVVVSP